MWCWHVRQKCWSEIFCVWCAFYISDTGWYIRQLCWTKILCVCDVLFTSQRQTGISDSCAELKSCVSDVLFTSQTQTGIWDSCAKLKSCVSDVLFMSLAQTHTSVHGLISLYLAFMTVTFSGCLNYICSVKCTMLLLCSYIPDWAWRDVVGVIGSTQISIYFMTVSLLSYFVFGLLLMSTRVLIVCREGHMLFLTEFESYIMLWILQPHGLLSTKQLILFYHSNNYVIDQRRFVEVLPPLVCSHCRPFANICVCVEMNAFPSV